MAKSEAAGQIESMDKIPGDPGSGSGRIRLHDRQFVGTSRAPGRWIGYTVILCAGVTIHPHPLQAGRVRILQILHHPQPAPLIKIDGYRLAYLRLAGHQTHLEAVGWLHALGGLGRVKALGNKLSGQCQNRQESKSALHGFTLAAS